ncbi:MAG: TIGR04282 family arsenosugar biosynthesis glycosyltransferase [Gammaproteobacteria bacterium]|nr:TIGR04282 family arsenosugar biosynthesis glycosyltransferase [Gammaproteobacteria bacterium]
MKTRLAAQIGAESALRLYLAMLHRVVATVERTALAEFHLWAASDPGHEEFTALCDVQDIRLQQGEDLGSRMHNAAAAELAEDGVECVLIVGSDCPALTPDYLEQALDALSAGVEVVLGPARDGGYVLIGLRQVSWKLFSGVDWSGPGVLEQTLERVREAGLSHQLLESSWDVDDAEDLPLLEALRPPLSWSR